jgi:ribosomal protein L3 glutamine methyltransferase
MTKRAKASPKRGRSVSKFPKVAAGELNTLLDFVRYAVSRFVEAKLVFAHGTTDPVAEAAFLVCETLHLHPDRFESFATARVTASEAKSILDLIARRVASRKPAAYLVNKIYMRGLPFYVDERAIVPRRRCKTCSISAPARGVSPCSRVGIFPMRGSMRWTFPGARSRSRRAILPTTDWKTG